MNMQTGKGWTVTPFRGGPTLHTASAPNWFYRLMHRLIGGVIWKRQ